MITVQCGVPAASNEDDCYVEVNSTKTPGVVELRVFSEAHNDFVKAVVNAHDLALAATTAAKIEWRF